MADWARQLVQAIDERKTSGGVQNIMQPGRIVSLDPPVVEVCGVQIERQVNLNPAMLGRRDTDEIEAAMEVITTAFEELESVKNSEPPEIVEAVMALSEPITGALQAVVEVLKKDRATAGDQVMIRQDGNDIHVLGGTGGGGA